MRPLSREGAILALGAVALFGAVAFHVRRGGLSFTDPEILTGYLLFAVLLGLALFAGRKRLPAIAVGRASLWMTLHLVAGLFALALFWLHSGILWPSGLYEQALAALFYFAVATGVLGYLLQRAVPVRLTRSGYEVIYERIPSELARLRAAAEEVVLTCVEETGNEPLAQHYHETLHWYFQKPRFFLSHAVGSMRAQHWLHHKSAAVERYLDNKEKRYHRELYDLAREKSLIDLHYAQQSLMKWWLFAHVPAAAALMVFAVWHLILVNVYAI